MRDESPGWDRDDAGWRWPGDADDLGLRVTPVAGGLVLEIRGHLEGAADAALHRTLVELGEADHVVVDLADVIALDPAAVDELGGLGDRLRRHGGSLAVCHTPPALQERITSARIAGLDGDGERADQRTGTWWQAMLDEQVAIHQCTGFVAQHGALTPAAAGDLMDEVARDRHLSVGELADGILSGRVLVAGLLQHRPRRSVPTVEGDPPSRPATVRVLYIEDHPGNVRLMRAVMRSSNVSLEVATTGADGVAAATRHRPDVVIVDLDLPDFDGEEVTRRLRQDPSTATVPVMILTADASPGLPERLLAAGAESFLTKPFDLPELRATIARLASTPGTG